MKKLQISVLLCVYNPDMEMLYKAVNSIIHQSFEEWEMILYDDGSDEKYTHEIERTAGMDKRIRYVRNKEHHSLAYGLNQGLQMAKGKYIARMDADDISYPDRFKLQFKFLEEHTQYMWVGSNISLIDKNEEKWKERRYPKTPGKKDFLQFSPYAHPSVMIRRKKLLEAGGYKIGRYPYRAEDYELFMRLHAAGKQGANLSEILLAYREDEESYKKRKLKFQLQEVRVRAEGFRKLKILTPCTLGYVLKPLIIWMIPNKWIYRLKYHVF